jgi:hypothetical protein
VVFRGLGCVFPPFGIFAFLSRFACLFWYPVCARLFNTPSLSVTVGDHIRMRVCWAAEREEAPGRGFFAVWVVFSPLRFLRA